MVQMNRRKLLSSLALAATLSVVPVVTTGCNDDWVQTAINDIPAAVAIASSITQIIALATGNGAITPAVNAVLSLAAEGVKTGLEELQSAIQAYKTSKDPSTLGKVTDVLNKLLGDLPNILTKITIIDPNTNTAITTGFSLLIAALSAIRVLIPTSVTGKTAGNPRAAQAHAQLTNTVVPSAAQMKSQFNAVAYLSGYPQVIVK